MTGLLSTIDPGSFTQITAGSMMVTLYTIYLTWARPFEELRDNIIAILSGILLILTFLSAFLVKSQKLVEDSFEALGLGAVLITATVLIIMLFSAWAWYSFHDLGTSSGGMAARALKSSVVKSSVVKSSVVKSSVVKSSRSNEEGLEMGERRGSTFEADNPMHKEEKEKRLGEEYEGPTQG